MLSAAILVMAFVLVAAAGGGSMVWLYRAAADEDGRYRPPRETVAASPVAGTQGDDQAPEPAIGITERSLLAWPAPAESCAPGRSGRASS